jgi:hypothetical protein
MNSCRWRTWAKETAMNKMMTCLVVGIALFALASAAPAAAPATAGRHHWHHSRHYVHHHRGPNLNFGDPDRYFGVDPGSYECFGYDCNW